MKAQPNNFFQILFQQCNNLQLWAKFQGNILSVKWFSHFWSEILCRGMEIGFLAAILWLYFWFLIFLLYFGSFGLLVYLGRSVGGGAPASLWTTHGPFHAHTKVQVWIASRPIGNNKLHAGLKENASSMEMEENSPFPWKGEFLEKEENL